MLFFLAGVLNYIYGFIYSTKRPPGVNGILPKLCFPS